MAAIEKIKITELVDSNYIYASVLYYFGIEFYNYSEYTLEQACYEKGLNPKSVINGLESFSKKDNEVAIQEYPIDLIIEYLKHTHFIFIKQKLPYIGNLIQNFNTTDTAYQNVAKDLKFVFPLFVEDFIHHIYEEEDTLFEYICRLDNYKKGKGNISKLYFEMERNSLGDFASEHEEHDDEMNGIRQITNGYEINKNTPLHIKIIYSELEALERELQTHANVENEILFPKAMMLEKDVSRMLQTKTKFN